MKRRSISLVLCVCMIISLIAPAVPHASAITDTVQILCDGESVSEIVLKSEEKKTLTARTHDVSDPDFQWQILLSTQNNLWVNIYDKTAAECEISYALVKNMLDAAGSTYIRCAVSCGNETFYSSPVCISIVFTEDEPMDAAEASMVLLDDLQVIPFEDEEEEETEETEETTEATEQVEAEETLPEGAKELFPEEPEETEATEPTEVQDAIVPDESEETEPTDSTEPSVSDETEEITPDDVTESTEPEVSDDDESAGETEPSEMTPEPTAEVTKPSTEASSEPSAPSADPDRTSMEKETQGPPVEPAETTSAASEETSFLGELASIFVLEASAAEISPEELDTEDQDEYVTITIKYLDATSLVTGVESSIYSSYTATVLKNSHFRQNVVSPTFLGFAPYYDGDGDGSVNDDASVIELNFDAVQEDLEYKVYYRPIDVDYAIRYFFQNINNDLYSEDTACYHTGKAETGTIITDEMLLAGLNGRSTNGFTKLFHYPEAIAADGSTVFECYYDRNYYLLQFDLDGGYGVDPIYSRYGTPFVITNPVRHGYQFAGWDEQVVDESGHVIADGDGRADTLPSTIPAEGRAYKALWETTKTSYTVVYWRENANDNGYSYWGSNIIENVESTTRVNGTDNIPSSVTTTSSGLDERQYFTFNSVLSDKNVLVDGDGSTVVNVYYTRNFYQVDFQKSSSLCALEEHTHSDSCYGYICRGSQHEHTDECLSCTIPVHAHNEDCCTVTEHIHSSDCCGITYHVHSNSCCTKEEHTAHSAFCCDKEHSHTKECWDNVGSVTSPTNAPTRNLKDGLVYRYRPNRQTPYSYYIYIDGSWYNYDATIDNYKNNLVLDRSCGKEEHIHGDGKCSCSKEIHTHGDGNCSCSETAHDHTSGCDVAKCCNGGFAHTHGDGKCVCSQDAHTHGELCYSCGSDDHKHSEACLRLICTKGAHMHSSNCTNSSKTNVVYRIIAKYDADIAWPDGKVVPGVAYWTFSTHSGNPQSSKVVNLTSNFCYDDGLLLTANSGSTAYQLNYYFESFDQTSPASGTSRVYNSTYKKYYDLSTGDNGYSQTAYYGSNQQSWNYKNIVGMTPSGSTSASNNNNTFNFYYDRLSYVLKYHNYNKELSDRQQMLKYGAPLSGYELSSDDIPYPESLEPNAYYFGGWYTSPGCYDGSEFGTFTYDSEGKFESTSFDGMTMPAEDMTLYAKWVPKTHNVNFFITYDQLLDYEAGDLTVPVYYNAPEISHGEFVGSVENPSRADDDNMGLTFAGWFYMEDGTKKAFSPLNIPINRDMNIFADWSSHSPQPYRINYVLLSDPNTHVAEPSNGFAYGGSTRTFPAKAGDPFNQLYPEYNTGYFPTVGSHSITMQYEKDKQNPEVNVFTFRYVKAEDISYTIRYVNRETNAVMEVENKTTSASVVTERFKAFENMVPDAFYKRLVISVRWDPEQNKYVGTDDNVITFYYTPNTTSAYYAVHYMMEKPGATESDKLDYAIDGSGGYEETGTHVEGIGDVNSYVSIEPQTFLGFSLIEDHAVTVMDEKETYIPLNKGEYSIQITTEGTELYIFYARQDFDYTVHYYLYNTTTPVSLTDYPSKSGRAPYDSVVTESAEKIPGYTCVSAEKQSLTIRDKENQNVIIFYYSPTQYVVEYVAVPADFGHLSTTIEVIAGDDDFVGSTPSSVSSSEFAGWYLDEACTKPVTDEGTIDEATGAFLPDKHKLSQTESNIFYAKFVRNTGDLTIQNVNAVEETQVFVYEVKETTGSDSITVTVVGNGSVTIQDLPCGQYTVTQQNSWSWRYADATRTFPLESDTTVQFDQDMTSPYWLNGNSPLIKNRKGGT